MSYFKTIYSHLTQKEKKLIFIFSIIALISLITLFLIIIKNKTIEVPKTGGNLKLGLVGQLVNTNPVLLQNEADANLVRLLFSNLSELSSNIEPEEDGKVWRVRLKENIFWSDSKKITSDDIIFTLEKIKESKNDLAFYSFWQNVLIQRSSELEIKFILDKPYSFFPEILDNFFIVPKHIFADIPLENWKLSEFNLKPVSNGPYKIKNLNIEKTGFISFADLETNFYYPDQKPFIPQITVKFYPNNESLIKDFNLGQVDAFVLNSPTNLSLIKRPYNSKDYPISNYYAVFINQSENLALKDINVRKAMSLSLNHEELVQNIFKNNVLPIYSPLPWFKNEPKDEYNPDLASKILEDNGWKLNADGIREKKIDKDTIQLKFNLILPDIDFLKRTAEELKKYWSKIGIQITISPSDPQFLALNNLKTRNYELILFGNIIYPKLDLYPFWHSKFVFWPGANLSLYNDTSSDDLMLQIQKDIKKENLDKNLTLLLENIHNNYPAIFLYSPNYILITNKNINGIETNLVSNSDEILKNIKSWYIKTKRVFKTEQ